MTGRLIAAFDLATVTGCADGRAGDRNPRLWSWDLHDGGDDRPRKLAYLRRFLDAYFAETQVDEVIYELPMNIGTIASMMKRGIFVTSEDVLMMLRGLIGVLEASAAHHGLPVRGIDVKDARKHLTGQRTFPDGTAKQATLRACRALGWPAETDNESDAAALWSLACGQANPRIAAAMTRAHMAAKEPAPTPGRKKRPLTAGPLFEDK